MGQVLITPYKNHNVLTLYVKEKSYDSADISTLLRTLENLKRNLFSFRIARRGDVIDQIEPGLLVELLHKVFDETPTQITVCLVR